MVGEEIIVAPPKAIDDCVRLDTRLAGQVRRYHTWPILGQQTIAEHSWQIMRIYLSVAEKPDVHMMYYITTHDIGEHYVGDIPFPVKRENHQLKEQMDFLEARSSMTQLDHWDAFQMVMLSEEEKKLFKQIEIIEMAEFGMDQMALGNSHGFIIAARCLRAVYEDNPHPRLAAYVVKRLKIFFDQCELFSVYKADEAWWWISNWEAFNASER